MSDKMHGPVPRLLTLTLLSALLASCVDGGSGGGEKAASSTSSEISNVANAGNISRPTSGAPIADAGPDQDATAGETVTFDGSASFDPDGDPLAFLWEQIDGDTISLPDDRSPGLTLIAPGVMAPNRYRFRLSVTDGASASTDTVELIVFPVLDVTPPLLVSRSPGANETGVAPGTTITVVFNEPLAASTVNAQSMSLRQSMVTVPGTVSYSAGTFSATFTPDSELDADTPFAVSLSSDITDAAGNPYAGTTWSFTTGSAFNLGPTGQGTIDACMSDADRQMLTLVNNARAQARSCGSEPHPAVSALAWHCSLEQAAAGHSTDMANNNFFSHTGSDGLNAGHRISATSYPWRAWGENIAAGYATVESAMAGWLGSPGHCSNIMNAGFTEMGAASATNPGSDYRVYWTQVFADR